MATTTAAAGVQPSPFSREVRRRRALRRMSQLELATLAGTTQRHLSFVESGRSVPGRAMVVRLAEALGLTLRERNALLLTAGYAPAYAESPRDAATIEPAMTALRSILTGHLPYPAVIAGPRGELVLANAAFDVLAEGAAARLLEPPVNVLRLALHPEGMAPRVVNLAAWGRHITESLRARAAAHPDPALDALAAELAGYLPAAAPPGPDHLGFAVPLRLRTAGGELRLLTTLTSFATAVDVTLAELHLEAFLPADPETGELLRRRAAVRAAAPGV
ncbi:MULTISPECIES: helix-turn-helix domain-containing protein [unclassified Streptomyces]|uniref:helix-turn-helix domain-containing protein n=1 Tax=unclassified Streptomyces TaxID=2593676 RepID=UPI002257F198|nr:MULTISPECIES: helix-turn-helix transcriptional regulator [unclassified Streptomyces]MCX4524449.1 helix-turn-helix transcriptional regulator [Streptomyces sp. NBC_01551]MCX4545029.1 helix-turn-helix transcriptional regulator [Streptomyces sp. NBC_01565]